MSTENWIIELSGRVTNIIGFPYSEVKTDEIPIEFTREFETIEPIDERVAPIEYRISVGGGVRKSRKAIGNAAW